MDIHTEEDFGNCSSRPNLSYLFAFILLLFISNISNSYAGKKDFHLVSTIYVDKLNPKIGDQCIVAIAFHNTSSVETKINKIEIIGNVCKLVNILRSVTSIPPNSSDFALLTVIPLKKGELNLVFSIEYEWLNTSLNISENRKALIASNKLISRRAFDFDWPNYLIPLIIGLFIGLFSAWFAESTKYRKEKKEKTKHALSVLCSLLFTAKKSVELREQVSFVLWEESIIRGNLFRYLDEFGNENKIERFSFRLAEFSALIREYNNRLSNKSISEDDIIKVLDEVINIINIIENNM